MLNPFPSLLMFSFFAPTLLRLSLGIVFLYLAQFIFKEKRALLSLKNIPFVGHMQAWMVWWSAGATALVGLALMVGFGTQWAALLGLLITAKHAYATKDYQDLLPFHRSTYLLMLVMSLSLLLSGAGAFAFDLPL